MHVWGHAVCLADGPATCEGGTTRASRLAPLPVCEGRTNSTDQVKGTFVRKSRWGGAVAGGRPSTRNDNKPLVDSTENVIKLGHVQQQPKSTTGTFITMGPTWPTRTSEQQHIYIYPLLNINVLLAPSPFLSYTHDKNIIRRWLLIARTRFSTIQCRSQIQGTAYGMRFGKRGGFDGGAY